MSRKKRINYNGMGGGYMSEAMDGQEPRAAKP